MSEHNDHKSPEQPDNDLKKQAIKYKAFQHTFTSAEIDKGISEKVVLKKLKESQHLESSYENYLKNIENNPLKTAMFPWDSPARQFLYLFSSRLPSILRWSFICLLLLFFINFIPGPTQHIAEFIFARAFYDTAGIPRLPESLETYAHSAEIVDDNGSTIKSYGKRKVTQSIPPNVKMALLACEDHYLLPHPQNPWYINSFFIHAGVSWINLFGAVKDTLMGDKRGASTIIMQNAKKILGNENRTISNKLEEIIFSYILVAKFGKELNLDFYINTVPVGSNMYGFNSAAENYFKKDLAELNYQQLVTIGSFIPNHNRQLALYDIWKGKSFADLSPTRLFHAKSAIGKINMALNYLLSLKEISAEQHTSWLISDEESIRRIGFRDFRSPLYGEEEWTSWNVIREVTSRSYMVRGREISGTKLILDEKGDVVIETGVNIDLVEKIKDIINQFIEDKTFRQALERKNETLWKKDLELYEQKRILPPYNSFEEFMTYLYKNLNIGVIITNQKGRFLAYIGGKEFLKGSRDSVDDVQPDPESKSDSNHAVIIDLMDKKATIPPSSTIKPIIAYYTMLAGNATLQSMFQDKPLEYKYVEREEKKIWLPRNWYPYDGKGQNNNRYLGRNYSLLEAQVLSVNTIFARLYTKPTIRSAMLSGFDRINLEYDHENAKYWPFGIGADEVPVQQWLGVYNAFYDGYYRHPSFVKRIRVNNEVIFDADSEERKNEILLFDSKKERENEMQALYEVCNRGSGASMKSQFKYHKNLVSGKTGTAPNGRTSLFVSHFNPYLNRAKHADQNISMIVIVTTNTGGYKSVGDSTQGPTQIAGKIYDYLFNSELQKMMDTQVDRAKRDNAHFRNNHIYWANVNTYMDTLLNKKCGNEPIYNFIEGVDSYQEALEQILNPNIQIYTGKNDMFDKLVEYYCDEKKLIRMNSLGQ
nr:penicillin-binding protein [Desulfobulbaceae bacterium]